MERWACREMSKYGKCGMFGTAVWNASVGIIGCHFALHAWQPSWPNLDLDLKSLGAADMPVPRWESVVPNLIQLQAPKAECIISFQHMINFTYHGNLWDMPGSNAILGRCSLPAFYPQLFPCYYFPMQSWPLGSGWCVKGGYMWVPTFGPGICNACIYIFYARQNSVNPSLRCKVLLIQFTENINIDMNTEMFELFSGKGAVSSVFRNAGVATVSYDRDLKPGQRHMDFLSPAGFALEPHFVRMEVPPNYC